MHHLCLSKQFRLILVVLLMLAHSQVSAQTIRVLYEEGVDAIGSYCMGMLELALSRIEHSYEIEAVTGDRTIARAVEDVRSGDLHLMWNAGGNEVEELVLPIRIPLYKGLLGHRIFIIRKGDQARFDSINTLEDLKRVKLGQGVGWADTVILKANDLSVVPVHKYSSFFYMLDGGRFDAFPRGLQEPWREIAGQREMEFVVEERLMLVYRMPFYLFVSYDNPKLAADIERGLNLAIADGGFDEFFFNDPTVQDALARSNIQNRTVIELKNPSLPPNTPLEREELWLNVRDLQY